MYSISNIKRVKINMKQKITLILFTLSFGFLFSPMANVEAKSMIENILNI